MKKLTRNQKLFIEKLPTYIQSTGGLRDNDGFCCMGVACDVSGLDKWDMTQESYLGEKNYLPREISNWLDIRLYTPDPTVAIIECVGHIQASKANDEYQWDFATIARLFEHLFTHDAPAYTDEDGNILQEG